MTRYTTPRTRQAAAIPSQQESFPSGRISADGQLTFGKYKGKDLAWVARNDSGYIRWALEKGVLNEADLKPQELQSAEHYAQLEQEVEDSLGEIWADVPEQYSTSRRVPDHELHESGSWAYGQRFFP